MFSLKGEYHAERKEPPERIRLQGQRLREVGQALQGRLLVRRSRAQQPRRRSARHEGQGQEDVGLHQCGMVGLRQGRQVERVQRLTAALNTIRKGYNSCIPFFNLWLKTFT